MFSSLKVGWTEGPAHFTLAKANNSRMWINSHPACNKTYQGKKEGEAGLLGLRESPVVVLFSGGRSRWWGYGSRQGCWWSTVQLCSLLWCSLSLEKEKLVAVKLQEHAALLLPWNGVALGVNESGAGWRWVAMLLCEKKRSRCRCWSEETLLELRFATAAGRYWCYTGGITFTSRLKRRGRLSWVFGRRRWEVYRSRFIVCRGCHSWGFRCKGGWSCCWRQKW